MKNVPEIINIGEGQHEWFRKWFKKMLSAPLIVPIEPPKLTQEEANVLLQKLPLQDWSVKLLGIRGYYKKTMGNPVSNDRGIYDDAMFLVTPDMFGTYNANTDPSVTRKHIAVLKAGNVYWYRKGKHKISGPNPYPALRQASDVIVIRDQEGEFRDSPNNRFWINIHRGGLNSTSSEGCQTVYPKQWDAFLHSAYSQMDIHKQTLIPYALIEI